MLTAKQEKFVLNLFQGMSQREAYTKAGYSTNFAPAIVDKNACVLAKNSKILVRLKELQGKVENAAIMSVSERKERLSEIARARLTDYQEAGADGAGYINIGKESPNTAAIAGIKSSTKFDENGNTGTLYTEIKLHNPIMAIAELNKMEKLYNDDKQGVNVNVNVAVMQARDLTDDELASIAARGSARIVEQKASKESLVTLLSVHDDNIRDSAAPPTDSGQTTTN